MANVALSDSILTSVKKLMGLREENVDLDPDVITGINTELNILLQLGAGPKDGLQITDSSLTWASFTDDPRLLGMAVNACNLRTRLIMDPPQIGHLVSNMQEQLRELEWRIMEQCGRYFDS